MNVVAGVDLSIAIKCFFTVFSIACWSCRGVGGNRFEEDEALKRLDKDSYRIKPYNSGLPVTVNVSLTVQRFTSISDYDMDFEVQLVVKQEWMDERLKMTDPKANITLTDPAEVWTPSLYIVNEKDSELHTAMKSNTYLVVQPTGRVQYTARLSMTLSCQMQLERFPFDAHNCDIILSTFSPNHDDATLRWAEARSLSFHKDINIMGFTVEQGTTSVFSGGQTPDRGGFDCLKASFLFRRDLRYYILHTFLPSFVLVVVSWTSFWMDRRALVARILLVLSTLFAMSSLATDIEASVPHVPYVKAMDLWSGVCFTFLMAALVEFAAVNATSPPLETSLVGELRNDEESNTAEKKPLFQTATSCPFSDPHSASKSAQLPIYLRLLERLPKDPRRIDAVARVVFPSFFFAFVFLYFSYFLINGSSDSGSNACETVTTI